MKGEIKVRKDFLNSLLVGNVAGYVLMILVWGALLLVIFSLYPTTSQKINVKINHENFTLDETGRINTLLSHVNPLYMSPTKSITFVKSRYDVGCVTCEKGNCIGCNRNGDIWIYYIRDDRSFAVLVCHELLHNYIKDEDVTKDIDDTLICYDEGIYKEMPSLRK